MFARSDDETGRKYEIETRGILTSGNYTAFRGMSEDLTSGGVDITGSGMFSLNKKTGTVNWTQEERSVAAGRMNVSEYVGYGGES